MGLVAATSMMRAAEAGNYAVGYFESWSLDSLLGVIDAAKETRSPVIIGFNGDFLSRQPDMRPEDLAVFGATAVSLAARAEVPCVAIFNECDHDAWTEVAIRSGFNLVMPAGGEASPAAFTSRVRRIADIAHAAGVAVEAEVAETALPAGSVGALEENGEEPLTSAEDAARFVAETRVDLLAISVGNQEIKLDGRAPLDVDSIARIRRSVDVPLVLHGGTGIDDDSLRAGIRAGIRKVNYGTYIKQRYLSALRSGLAADEPNPHALLGDGSDTDLVVIGRAAVRDAVLERIELLGCCGRA